MRVCACAKINLALDVTGKRPDGYHEIESIFQTVSICDEISVELTKEPEITIECSMPEDFRKADPIPCDERNIAYKSAKKFFEDNNINMGCRINIKKCIPSQAGMGGGSTDAGAVLYCLKKLTRGEIISPEKLGADVPFFLTGGTAYVTGIGENIEKIKNFYCKAIVVAKGNEGVSTAEAYRKVDNLNSAPLNVRAMREAIENNQKISRYVGNVFEGAIALPEVADIKNIMLGIGAESACMTGSGSAVFGIFNDISTAENCVDILTNKSYWARLCTPTDKAFEEL